MQMKFRVKLTSYISICLKVKKKTIAPKCHKKEKNSELQNQLEKKNGNSSVYVYEGFSLLQNQNQPHLMP